MTTPQRAAIYARISSDPSGQALGVQRQLEDCRKLAAERGWLVADEYVDNDKSAYSGSQRPRYRQMLTGIAEGRIDGVIAYNADRLTRRLRELEELAALCASVGVTELATVSQDLNFGDAGGMLAARMFGAVAEYESARKAERLRRAYEQKAASGRPHLSHRPYGFELDGITARPDEQAVIRESVARLLAGESLISIVKQLNADGVRTATGKAWQTPTLKRIVTNPRAAGLREYRGEVIGPGIWEPIIDEATWRRVLAVFEAKKVAGRRVARRYLLSGLLRCGRCGNRLFSSYRKDNDTRRYVCSSGPDHGGCGRLTVVAPPVEQLLADAVLYRLDSNEVADALAGRAARDERASGLQAALAADQAMLEELATAYAERQITMREWRTAREPVEARIHTASRQLAEATGTTVASAWIGQGAALRASWEQMNLDRQTAIVRSILDHAVIAPGKQGSRELDPNRVDPRWLL